MTFMAIPANDQSVYYLGMIFGQVGSVLNNPAGSRMLGAIFKAFNTSVLTVGGVLFLYTLVVGLIKTAAEGKFLGEKWNSIWVPFRMVVGIATLYPTATGYSVIQVIMMWIILQGVAAADQMWTTVLTFVQVAGSPYASTNMPATSDVTDNFQNLFQALTCEASMIGRDLTQGSTTGPYFEDTYQNLNSMSYQPYYYCADPAHSINGGTADVAFCSKSAQLKIWDPKNAQNQNPSKCLESTDGSGNPIVTCNIGSAGACGSITYADDSVACANGNSGAPSCVAAQAQTKALIAAVSTMEVIANQFVKYDHDYLAFTENVNNVPGDLTYQPDPTNTGLNVTGWIVPTWITDYCQSAYSTPIANCCVFGLSSNASGCGFVDTSSKNPIFPPPYSPNTNGTEMDYSSASNSAVQQLLWNFGILKYVTGAGPQQEGAGMGSSDFISATTTAYSAVIQAAVTDLFTNNAPQLTGDLANQQSMGWIMAGSYYYNLASNNNNNLKAAIPSFSVTVTPASGAVTAGSSTLSPYRNNLGAAAQLITILNKQNQGSIGFFAGNPQLAQVGTGLNGLASGIMGSFMDTMTGDKAGQFASNPLSNMQSLGEKFIITAETVYPVFLAIAVAILVAADINGIALGFGMTQEPAEVAMAFFFYTCWALLMLFLGWLVSFGGILAIYTPMIPYVIFTMASIGWFTATIEAMTAAPLIGLGIIMPGGDHEILGHASHSVMIIYNVFLRPTMMILGMMISMLLVTIVVSFINNTFKGIMGEILPNPGIPELIFLISAYVMLIVTAMNKCFALIHILPAKALTWLSGGQAISYGEEQAERAVGAGVKSTAQSVGGAMAASIEAIQDKAEERMKAEARLKRGEASLKGEDAATLQDSDASPTKKAYAERRNEMRKANDADSKTAADPKSTPDQKQEAKARIQNRSVQMRKEMVQEGADLQADAKDDEIINSTSASSGEKSAAQVRKQARLDDKKKEFKKNKI